MWSVGLILLHLVTLEAPWQFILDDLSAGLTIAAKHRRINSEKEEIELEAKACAKLRDILCKQKHIPDRLTAKLTDPSCKSLVFLHFFMCG